MRSNTLHSVYLLIFTFLALSPGKLSAQGQGNGNGGNGQGAPPVWKLSGNDVASGDFLGTTNNMPLIFKANGSEHLRLLSNGKFGIGTSTPQYRLSVDGRLGVSDTSVLNSTRITGPFYLQDGSSAQGRILVSDNNGRGTWKDFGSVSYWTKSGSDLYSQGVKVGIGTNNPLKAFDVNGDALVRETLYVNDGLQIGNVLEADSNETRIRARACVDGRLGIGTTSPGEKLTVKGNARVHGKTTTDSLKVHGRTEFGYATFDSLKVGDSSIVIGTQTQANTPNNKISTTGDGPLLLNPESQNDHHTGNVGIGSTDPKRKLHVKGTHTLQIGDDPDLTGDHAGIRLENSLVTIGQKGPIATKSFHWDIVPLGNSNENQLDFTKGGYSKPLLSLKHDRDVRVNGKLTVKRDDATNLTLTDPDDGSGNNFAMNFKMHESFGGVSNGGVAHIGTGGNPPTALAFTINDNIDRSIVLRGGGRVGVGLSDPKERFHIQGNSAKLRVGEQNNYIKMGYNGANAVLDNHGKGRLLLNWHSGNNVVVGSDPQSGGGGTANLTVHGTVNSCEVIVDSDDWCDYVFKDSYELMPIEEVEEFTTKYHHLPGVPTSEAVKENGLSLAQMQKINMEKTEELFRYSFKMNDKIEKSKNKLLRKYHKLKENNEKLRNRIKK